MLAGFGRFLVFLTLALAGYLLAPSPAWGALFGTVVGGLVLALEALVGRTAPRQILSGSFGLLVGLLLALLAGTAVAPADPSLRSAIRLGLAVGLGWIGFATGVRHSSWFSLQNLRTDWEAKAEAQVARNTPKILDTSVIIDGRIADVAETGFLGGTLIIPQFILRELQQVADSPDSSKRQRGRRGLDMLQRLRNNSKLDIQIVETDFPAVKEVDLKLIELGKQLEAVIVTNDFNLNKVSQLRGVAVLNINELANALKPVVLPGEAMKVFILKEGKEYNQGVAYLDDGTMVVVDNARKLIGKNAEVAVTSVLQTTAGKMIFGKLWEDATDQSGNLTNIHESRPPLMRKAYRDLRHAEVTSIRVEEEEYD
jgi:uncharacterized protein YacL